MDEQGAALLGQALSGSATTDTADAPRQEPAPTVEPTVAPDAGASQAAETKPPASPVDWERRFKGLQRRYNADRQRLEELEQRLSQYEEALIEQMAQQYPEEERAERAEMLRAAAHLRRMYETVQLERAQNEELARLQTIQTLANWYGVEPQVLEPFDNPDEMHLVAYREWMKNQELQRTRQQLQRLRTGADRFEGQGAAPTTPRPRTEDEAAAEFAKRLAQLNIFR